jgi:hypothetical protein
MSLINDALKRARESQRKNPTSVDTRASGPAPVVARKKERDLEWVLPVVIVLLIIVAFFFIMLAMIHHSVKKMAVVPENSETQQVEAAAPATPPEPLPEIGPAALIGNSPKPTRVQGIGYDPVHPWAIISGHTVYVGDDVDGMRVTAISRNSITLVGNGKTNTLVVGQQ